MNNPSEEHTPSPGDEPGLIRGDKLADGAPAAGPQFDADEQALHPGLVRGADLADGAAPDDETVDDAVEQAKHPGGVRGRDLADE